MFVSVPADQVLMRTTDKLACVMYMQESNAQFEITYGTGKPYLMLAACAQVQQPCQLRAESKQHLHVLRAC